MIWGLGIPERVLFFFCPPPLAGRQLSVVLPQFLHDLSWRVRNLELFGPNFNTNVSIFRVGVGEGQCN